MRKKTKVLTILLTAVMVLSSLLTLAACNKTVIGIEITKGPTKTDYVAGQKFDPTGMVVSLVYENGKTKELDADEYTYSPSGKLTASTRKITVTYNDGEEVYTASVNIKVHNNIVKAVKKSDPNKLSYYPGEIFDPTGMVITVTYENGSKSDVAITSSNATFKTEPLTAEDTTIVVQYNSYRFYIDITLARGLFIEAENGIIDANDYSTPDDAVDVEEQYQATGGTYVGNLFAGDSITFVFDSDIAGKVDIAFRLASQYLKESGGEWGWTPILMGDSQFNRICEFTVNGVPFPIDDSVILPGGGESGGEPNANLWLNWKEVEFKNIDVVAGRNDIKLTFKQHNYTDVANVAQHWAGRFAANVDSLKITSQECTITAHPLVFEQQATVTSLVAEGDKVFFVIEYTYISQGYSDSELAEKFNKFYDLPLVLEGNPYAVTDEQWAIYGEDRWEDWGPRWYNPKDASYTKDGDTLTFTLKYEISEDGMYIYSFTAHLGGAGADYDFKPPMDAFEQSVEVNHENERWRYTMVYIPNSGEGSEFWGCIGIRVYRI